MNKQKLSMLILNKRQELKMTQQKFAEYFSEITGNKVTYGFIQALENPTKTSTPEWINMKGIAKIYGVGLDELDAYLTNDEITDISEANEAFQRLKEDMNRDPRVVIDAVDELSINEKAEILKRITDEICKKLAQMDEAQKLLSAFKSLNLSQN